MILLKEQKINIFSEKSKKKLVKEKELSKLSELIEEYEEENNGCYGYIECPNCNSDKLIGYGVYERNIGILGEYYKIKIKRVLCKECGRTHALIPSFIIPYYQNEVSFILLGIREKEIEGKGIVEESKRLNITRQILYFWIKRFNSHLTRLKVTISNNIKKIINELYEGIKIREKYPRMTIKNIYSKLKEDRYIKEEIKIDTIYRYCKTNDMLRRKVIKEERRRYEKRYPNDTWQADTSYGPYIKVGDKKYRTYLIHFIDDNSRLVVGHGFYLSDSAINVQKVFKEAIGTYGIPKQIYLDNGKSYRNIQLELICARLGIKLTHTHAYDPESKGKVERCFKTIKEGWMYGRDWNLYKTLEELNKDYDEYLYESYNNKYHSEIEDTPNNRWHKLIKETTHRKIDEDKLEEAFMHEIIRKVNKDRTININNKMYEAPSIYKLQKVHLRYYIKNEEEIWIYENNERKEKLQKLNKQENSEIKRKIIDYSKIVNDEREVIEYCEEEKEVEYEE